jgi:hypothetical protein
VKNEIETKTKTNMAKLNRFNGWVGLLAFSCVVLGAMIQDAEINNQRDSNERYIIATCSVVIGLSFFTILGYLITDKVVGGIFEASLGTACCALWCGALSLMMNPNHNLAITVKDFSHVIRNTNLYFFTWAACLSSLYVLASIFQQYRLVDVQTAPTNLVRWYLFLIASVVVFGTASKLKPLTCIAPNDHWCRVTNYAVSLGVISAGLAVIPIVWNHVAKMNLIMEMIVGLVVTVFYCVGTAYITNVDGPGSHIGNFYFSTWFGFALSVLLTCSAFLEMIAPEPTPEESQHPEVTKAGAQQQEGEQQVESTTPQRGGQEQLEEVDVQGRDEEA